MLITRHVYSPYLLSGYITLLIMHSFKNFLTVCTICLSVCVITLSNLWVDFSETWHDDRF